MDGALHTSDIFITNLKGVESEVGGETVVADISINANLIPVNDGVKSIGDSNHRVNFLYSNILNSTSINAFQMSGTITPSTTNNWSIGTSNLKLADIHTVNISGFNLAGNITITAHDTLHLGGDTHRLANVYSTNVISETVKSTNVTLSDSSNTTHNINYGILKCSKITQYVNQTSNPGNTANEIFKEFNGTTEETQYCKETTSGNTAQKLTRVFRKRNIAGYEDIYGEPDTNGDSHLAFRYNVGLTSGSAFQAFDSTNNSGNYLFNLATQHKVLHIYDGTGSGSVASPVKSIVIFDMGNKKTTFSNDSNQKLLEIDHAAATSTISLYDIGGVKCLDFNATTGKTIFYQKTGVGTNTNIVLTIDPATPTTNASGLLTSSPFNINTSTLPDSAQKSDLGSGDLFSYHTGGSGNDFDYLCIKN
jgi:hypothetical protein